jgi:phosphatidylserine decarboxylase
VTPKYEIRVDTETTTNLLYRYPGLPSDHRVHKDWLENIIEQAKVDPKDFHPVLKEFRELIEGNTRIYLLVNSMFEEIPKKKPYSQDPVGHKQVRDYVSLRRAN